MNTARVACIFERNLQRGASSMGARVELCYELAEMLGLSVSDEYLAWDTANAAEPKPQALIDAVDECVRSGAALITHSSAGLSEDPDVRRWVAESLAGLELHTVAPAR